MNFFRRFMQSSANLSGGQSETVASPAEQPISPRLDENVSAVRSAFGNSADIMIRELRLGRRGELRLAVIYTDGLAQNAQTLIKGLLHSANGHDFGPMSGPELLRLFQEQIVPEGDVRPLDWMSAMHHTILTGDLALFLDGSVQGLAIGGQKWTGRNVEEPSTQSVVRGPREGFVESLRLNTAMIRRKIKDPGLWMENRQIGTSTHTDVVVMYIKDIVNEQALIEVRKRLDAIEIDSVLESNYIEEMIQDKQMTPFPTIYNSERPDVIAAGLLEGRIAILVDGTPFVLLVPALFTQFFQSSEDYYQRYDFATLVRLLRFLCLFLAMLTPSLYIAVTTFHQEMLPTTLLYNLVSQREGVPFPAFVEAVLMEITFEILREAGVRMPKAIGQSVSIVGTLVIGQAAVEAGLVSAGMVIVVAITAIANFVLPAFNMGIAVRMLRFLVMGLAASFGLYGITVGMIAIVLHLCHIRSFGVPYMSPVAPFHLLEQRDTLFRLPRWFMNDRPAVIGKGTRRIKPSKKPGGGR